MVKKDIILLRKASQKLHKEYGRFKCKEKCLSCAQCHIMTTIESFDLLIDLIEESKWSKAGR